MSQSQELADELTIVTWGGSAGEATESAFFEPFEEEYGVTVNQAVIGNDADLLTKLRAGGGDYDIIEVVDDTALTLIEEDMLSPMRLGNVPELEKIRDAFTPAELPFMDEWMVAPKNYGAGGLVHNTEQWPSNNSPQDWADLFTDQTRNKVSFPSWTNYAVGTAALSLDIPLTDLDDSSNVDRVFDKIAEWDDYMYSYYDGHPAMRRAMTNTSAIGGLWFYGRVTNAQSNGVPVEYSIPQSGALMWYGGVGILSSIDERSRYTAETWINDMLLNEDRYREYSSKMSYPPTYPVDDLPEVVSNNPVVEQSDRLNIFPPGIYRENQKEWGERLLQLRRE